MRRRWRHFATTSGRKPVRDYIAALPLEDRASVLAAMAEVRLIGLRGARHLRGDVYEVRAPSGRVSYRVLFADEGAHGTVLLSLHAFAKQSRKTPAHEIDLALARLADWRVRGRP